MSTDSSRKSKEKRSVWQRFRPTTPSYLLAATSEHYRDANKWLWYALFGGTLPFWGPWILFLFFDQSLKIELLFAKGELGMLSAGLLASALPVMQRKVKDSPMDHPDWFFRAAIAAFAVIVIMLAAITLVREFKLPGFRDYAVMWVSFAVFLVSISIGYAVELINNIRLFPNIRAVQELQMEDLESKFSQRLKHD
jgi:hypothetical protein